MTTKQQLIAWKSVALALEPAAREYSRNNPPFTSMEGVTQDPRGVHRALSTLSALSPGSGLMLDDGFELKPLVKRPEKDTIKLRLFSLFNRRTTRLLTPKELKAFAAANIHPDDLTTVEDWWNDTHPEWEGRDFRHRDLITLLNNWSAQVDKAESWKAFPPVIKKQPVFAR